MDRPTTLRRVSRAPNTCLQPLMRRTYNDCYKRTIFNASVPANAEPESVSIIAACKGRGRTLLRALPSWLQNRRVKDIVITDWGSTVPIVDEIGETLRADPRITVLRVSVGTGEWVLSRAFNLAALHARSHSILKLDCDTVLTPSFLDKHPLLDGQYYAGDWRAARDENELHLNGVLYVSRQAYVSVGGYDERITTYGWDDTDIQNRLRGAGLTAHRFNYDYLSHFRHSESMRTEHQPLVHRLVPKLSTERNRRRAELLPPWGEGVTRGQATLFQVETLGPQQQEVAIVHNAPVNSELIPAEKETAIKAAAGAAFLHDTHGIEWQELDETSPQHTIAASEFYGLKKPLLVLRAMHGLGNRMRALASAAVVAEATNRELLLVWPLDSHLSVPFGQLYSDKLDVMAELDIEGNPLLRRLFRVYDYMPHGEEKSHGHAALDLSGSAHVLVSSAYRINHPAAQMAHETAYLRQLVPVPRVMTLVHRYDVRKAVGVHIRQVAQDAGVQKGNEEYSRKGWALIRMWRARSTTKVFGEEMKRMLAKEPALKFFVICDDPQALAKFRENFGAERLITPTHGSCSASSPEARKAECAQLALAEMYIASRTSRFLGSTWSSFSAFISRLGGMPTRWSGVDFGQPKDAEVVAAAAAKPAAAATPQIAPPPPQQPSRPQQGGAASSSAPPSADAGKPGGGGDGGGELPPCTQPTAVRAGENLITVAVRLQLSVGTLYRLNPELVGAEEDPRWGPVVRVSQALCSERKGRLPPLQPCNEWHGITRGENVLTVAAKHKLSVWELLRMNPRIQSRDQRGVFILFAGQQLCVQRGGSGAPAEGNAAMA